MEFKDLKSRMIVNVFGVPGILLLTYLGRWYFLIFIIIVSVLAQKEFYQLSMKKGANPQKHTGIIAGSILIILYYLTGITPAIYLTLLFIMVFILITQLFTPNDSPISDVSTTILGILYIPALLGCMVLIREFSYITQGYSYQAGSRLLISLFVSVWIGESLAYLFGKMWGKKKLFERRSPKKTWIGAISGYLGALLVLLLFKLSGVLDQFTYWDVIVFSAITGIAGQMGDLTESMFKRDAGVKDSSNFLMGHGGVLDRFDSFFIISPLAYIYLILIL